MSSQPDSGIAIHHAPSGQGYRLLELPPDLVALLESDNPPLMTLSSTPNVAVLKAGDKTYSLRQKNTSNSLILLSPSTHSSVSSTPSQPALNSIATIHETIELIPETGQGAPGATVRGKWHERFGKTR